MPTATSSPMCRGVSCGSSRAMLKVLHAPESRLAAQARAKDVVEALNEMKLKTAAQWVDAHIDETLACYAYHSEHWIKLQTNNPMERLLKEARRRTKVVGAFPDGKSALMPVAARPRHVASTVGKRGDIRI